MSTKTLIITTNAQITQTMYRFHGVDETVDDDKERLRNSDDVVKKLMIKVCVCSLRHTRVFVRNICKKHVTLRESTPRLTIINPTSASNWSRWELNTNSTSRFRIATGDFKTCPSKLPTMQSGYDHKKYCHEKHGNNTSHSFLTTPICRQRFTISGIVVDKYRLQIQVRSRSLELMSS